MSSWGNKDYANNVPKFLYSNTDVYLATDTRLANATFGQGKAVSHSGWVKIDESTGFIAGLTLSNVNPLLVYTNTFLTITGSNTSIANARMVVVGGNNVSVIVSSGGVGYASDISVTASGANNSTLVFDVVPGGRLGRKQAEVLVALSGEEATDSNSGLPYFTGV
jgi:hypothetical protein